MGRPIIHQGAWGRDISAPARLDHFLAPSAHGYCVLLRCNCRAGLLLLRWAVGALLERPVCDARVCMTIQGRRCLGGTLRVMAEIAAVRGASVMMMMGTRQFVCDAMSDVYDGGCYFLPPLWIGFLIGRCGVLIGNRWALMVFAYRFCAGVDAGTLYYLDEETLCGIVGMY